MNYQKYLIVMQDPYLRFQTLKRWSGFLCSRNFKKMKLYSCYLLNLSVILISRLTRHTQGGLFLLKKKNPPFIEVSFFIPQYKSNGMISQICETTSLSQALHVVDITERL